MPSAVSSDNSIQVHSSIHLNNLADSIANCISEQTGAYTLLADAVWRSMEETVNNADHTVEDQTVQATSNCWNTAVCNIEFNTVLVELC